MDYKSFCNIISNGEQSNVDFKLECHAFANHCILAPKAELAKDICAMANNGNRTSYLIIGVSDDAKSFQSVSNKKLSDDSLQDFCKKAISPPPKVKMQKLQWRGGKIAHRNKEFVIIQIGPQKKQVFRLNQDFISYKEKVCYRRNEVWIRRQKTSDLATPDEIVRLSRGQPVEEDIVAKRERQQFGCFSEKEQQSAIFTEADKCLEKAGYTKIPESDRGGGLKYPKFWKKLGSIVVFVGHYGCMVTLKQTDLTWLNRWGLFPRSFFTWQKFAIPDKIIRLGRRRVRAIRDVALLSVIKSVPTATITRTFRECRRIGGRLHFYQPVLDVWRTRSEGSNLPTGRELLVIDNIQSVTDYTLDLMNVLKEAESITSTIMKP